MKMLEQQTKQVALILLSFAAICIAVATLTGCGRTNNTPTCTMTWTCGNQTCANAEGAWSGNGSFTGSNDESDCLVWETAFLNSAGYPNNRVTSCTCN